MRASKDIDEFLLRAAAARPNFLQDMTESAGRIMQAHAAYWWDRMGLGNVLAFGVVADPGGVFGARMTEFESLAAVESFIDNDPTVKSGSGFDFEIHPMPFGVVRPGADVPR